MIYIVYNDNVTHMKKISIRYFSKEILIWKTNLLLFEQIVDIIKLKYGILKKNI